MKVYTITCHDVYNYGASLQAYALQHYIESLGHEVRIIDYKPDYLSRHFSFSTINSVYDKPFVKQLYLLAKLPSRIKALGRKRAFDGFTTTYLKLTQERYGSCEELRRKLPEVDAYVAGSDQIWNTLFPNGRDAAFYLDFVSDEKRKISYAASFATDCIYNGVESFVQEKLRNFQRISVREQSAQTLLEKLGFPESVHVCDPVFLLSAENWSAMADVNVSQYGDYVFVYDCEIGNALETLSTLIARQWKLKIVAVNNHKAYADVSLPNIGPIEFISLLKGARYVVTNSFHAIAFSLIFRKQFYIVPRSEKINTRMVDFLTQLGLNERILSSSASQEIEKEVDYRMVDEKLCPFIAESKRFLNETLR